MHVFFSGRGGGPPVGFWPTAVIKPPKKQTCHSKNHSLFHMKHPRSDGMKTAYTDELVALMKETDMLRTRMESWYALRLEDEKVVDDKLSEYSGIMDAFDQVLAKATNSMKLVKNAIVSKQHICMNDCFFCFPTCNVQIPRHDGHRFGQPLRRLPKWPRRNLRQVLQRSEDESAKSWGLQLENFRNLMWGVVFLSWSFVGTKFKEQISRWQMMEVILSSWKYVVMSILYCQSHILEIYFYFSDWFATTGSTLVTSPLWCEAGEEELVKQFQVDL